MDGTLCRLEWREEYLEREKKKVSAIYGLEERMKTLTSRYEEFLSVTDALFTEVRMPIGRHADTQGRAI